VSYFLQTFRKSVCQTRANISFFNLCKELSIIVVRNFSGILDVGADGGWTLKNSRDQSEKIPNLVKNCYSYI